MRMRIIFKNEELTDLQNICCKEFAQSLFKSGYIRLEDYNGFYIDCKVGRIYLNFCPFCGTEIKTWDLELNEE
jgi:hypothetical protein